MLARRGLRQAGLLHRLGAAGITQVATPLATRACLDTLLATGCAQQSPAYQEAFRAASSSAHSSMLLRSISTSVARLAELTVSVPSMGESITEGSVAAILKQPGEVVREDDVIAQIETDKVTFDIKYPHKTPGVVKAINFGEGDSVEVGQAFCTVDESAEAGEAPSAAEQAPAAPAPSAEAEAPKAEEKQQAPAKPAPQQPAAAAVAAAPPPKAEKAAKAPPAAPAGEAAKPGKRPERRVKMTRLRMRVAERLKNAQNTYAMLSTFNEVDMTAIMDLRKAFKDQFFERHGVKLGFMSAFVKAAADALREVPAVNGVIDGDEIIYRDYYDISVAVATPKGLVVPVLRNVDEMSFADVEKTINSLGAKARDGTLSIDDMAGGTFTISNGGVFGSMLSTPIINPPQSAILGMHATNMKPAVVNGQIVARPMMYIALTYDHRLIDGREAVTFLKRIKEIIEDPRRLLLDV